MSTLQLENIKHVDATSNALELHSDGTVTISQVNGNVKADGFYHDGTLTDNIVFSQGTSTQNAAVALWGNNHGSFPGQVHIVGNSSNASADAGTISFWDFTGSSFQKNVSIDKDGRFLNPNQPAAVVKLNSDNSEGGQNYTVGPDGDLATSLATIKFETLVSNTGSHYSTSTGRFTCPVDGKYFVTFNSNVNMSDATGITFPELHKNNALYIRAYDSNDYNQGAWVQQSITAIVPCSAGDYLEIKLRCNSGFAWADSDTQYTQASFMLL